MLELTGPLETYSVVFGLDRLVTGVDNVRYDAYISPDFYNTAGKFIYRLMIIKIKDAGLSCPTDDSLRSLRDDDFRRELSAVMTSAINRAKLTGEYQVVFLALTALAKILMNKIREQFEGILHIYRQTIRKYETSNTHDLGDVFRIKEDMAAVQQKKMFIIRAVAKDVFGRVLDVWENGAEKSFIASFGKETAPPHEFLFNPVFFVDGEIDDFFMMDEYVLLSHKVDHPVRYEVILELLRDLLAVPGISKTDNKVEDGSGAGAAAEESDDEHALHMVVDRILAGVKNVDMLFDSQQTKSLIKKSKKEKVPREEILLLKQKAAAQKKIFDVFYKRCRKRGLLKVMAAAYEALPLVPEYCPPLMPGEIVNYLTAPGEREKIVGKLRRLKNLSGERFSAKALDKACKRFSGLSKAVQKQHLIEFVKMFALYHRDFLNFNLLKENIQSVNVIEDEKTLILSRANRLVYEFVEDDKAGSIGGDIRGHVILKSDIRGSTEITSSLAKKGLNPASYFSLNFFNPVNKVLPEYGASKVFIEGDALILSIFEEEGVPEAWFGVARACGLAMRILMIVQRYNRQSKKYKLPILEQGIGICYVDGPPAFLFDGDHRIMISSAINRADRLSSCNKALRLNFAKKKLPFNLYVFQEAGNGSDDDGPYIRYNVNGIEIEQPAFKKLSQEIDLKKFKLAIPEAGKEKNIFYTGIFPTQSGRYQRIVIREAFVHSIDPVTMKPGPPLGKKYYEVCTNSALYEKLKKKS